MNSLIFGPRELSRRLDPSPTYDTRNGPYRTVPEGDLRAGGIPESELLPVVRLVAPFLSHHGHAEPHGIVPHLAAGRQFRGASVLCHERLAGWRDLNYAAP